MHLPDDEDRAPLFRRLPKLRGARASASRNPCAGGNRDRRRAAPRRDPGAGGPPSLSRLADGARWRQRCRGSRQGAARFRSQVPALLDPEWAPRGAARRVDPRGGPRSGKTAMSGSGDTKQDVMADTDRIDALAAQIAAAMPDLDPALQQAALTLLRLLALGEPVAVQRLADALGLPAAYLDETLERSPGVLRDDQRRIIGFMGLSV